MGSRRFAEIGEWVWSAAAIGDVTIAYETWGTLNATCDNVVLIEHALTGDSHVDGRPVMATSRGGGRDSSAPADIDTDSWFVVAANVLGGCRAQRGRRASRGRPGMGQPLPLRHDS